MHSLIRRLNCYLTLAFFSLFSLVSMATPLDTQKLFESWARYYLSGQSEKLYEEVSLYQTELEGDYQYDFYFGVSAVDTGHVDEGVFVLSCFLE